MKENLSNNVQVNSQISLGSEFDVLHKVNPHILKEMSPVYQEAHKKAVKLVEGNRIHIDDFVNYKDLAKDKQAVVDKIREINSMPQTEGGPEAMVQAEILEAMIYDLIKSGKIFGDNVSAILPSNYDDLFLGNDIILSEKVGNARAYTGVGIDVTIGEVSALNKFNATKRRLENGQLGRVKYFKSEDGNYTGELSNIPHFVVGVAREDLFKLTSIWNANDLDGIKKMRVAKFILETMISQCDVFSKMRNENVRRVYTEESKRLVSVLDSLK